MSTATRKSKPRRRFSVDDDVSTLPIDTSHTKYDEMLRDLFRFGAIDAQQLADLDALRPDNPHLAKYRHWRKTGEWYTQSGQLAKKYEPVRPTTDRLAKLVSNRLALRPPAQTDYMKNGGSRRLVYKISSRGAARLRAFYESHGYVMPKTDYEKLSEEITRSGLEHILMGTETMVRVETALRFYDNVALLDRHAILSVAPDATKKRIKPHPYAPIWWTVPTANVSGHHTPHLEPDGLFGLHFRDRPAGKNQKFYFREDDRGTETIKSTLSNSPTRRMTSEDIKKNSALYNKFNKYALTHQQRLHHEVFRGMKSFAVLFITASQARIDRIIAMLRKDFRNTPAIFLFTDIESVKSSEDILTLEWRTHVNDKPVRLLD